MRRSGFSARTSSSFSAAALHLDQLAVLEPQGVAVVDGGLHVEIEMDLRPRLARQMRMALAPRRMVERDRVDHAVGLHGGLADDGGDAGHGVVSWRGRCGPEDRDRGG